MKPYRCLIFGLGKVGQEACSVLLRDGIEIVGAYSRHSHVGKDLGELLGRDRAGITVRASGDFKPGRGMADIALFFTTSSLEDLLGQARACLESGIDVVTIAEAGLYPWNHSPALAAELDAIAKAGGATLTATGVNDLAMTQMPAVLGAFGTGIKRIVMECTGDFGKFGEELLKSLPLGLDQSGFDGWLDAAASGSHGASIAGQSLEALLAVTDMQATEPVAIDVQPVWAEEALQVPTLDKVLAANSSCGITEIATARTTEGVELEMRLIGKVFAPHDEEYLHIQVIGDQVITLRLAPMSGVATTAALVLSRIPDVLAAAPGLQTTDRLPCPRLRVIEKKPSHE